MLIYKVLLGPVLMKQAKSVRRQALRLPEAPGPRSGLVQPAIGDMSQHNQLPLRLLVIGDSSAAGVGLEHQSQALAMQTASLLSQQLLRPVQWQLMAQTGLDTRSMLKWLDGGALQQLQPADVVISVLGVNDVTGQAKAPAYIYRYQQLLNRVHTATGARLMLLSGVPPMGLFPALKQPLRWYLGRYATALDHALKAYCGPTQETVTRVHVPLELSLDPSQMAADGFHPGVEQHKLWAQVMSQTILPRLQLV